MRSAWTDDGDRPEPPPPSATTGGRDDVDDALRRLLDGEPDPARRPGGGRTAGSGGVALAMVVALLLLTSGAYVGVTWTRAHEVCAEEVAFHRDRAAPSVASVAWSWWPAGIRCTWDDGSRTSLWWGTHQH
ncbi:hypothetical protein N866_05960 [Actinotalea ferrariae CF5-4]|uniref:Uncharacterized protein n=1 Tax=Actinotalea ferrariae CF5-4 TaxID=948458 RepID=A0A021VVJ1_9CELL|nr:hypothetical protein [Actinotalea ferrariae]EYR65209.1 hypothetical protein N866_05960 [Actinotalea ferrariae CF5-4]